MVSLTRYHAPAVVLIIAGVGVGVAVAGQAYSMVQGKETYLYSSGQIDESEIPADATVTSFEDLSPAAQEIFLTSQGQEDDYTTTKRASDLQYNDDDVAMDGYNYIRYEGDYYNLYAAFESGQDLSALVILTGGLSVALMLVVLGVVCWTYTLVKIPISVVGGLVVLGLDVALADVTVGVVGGGVVAMVFTWLALTLINRVSQATIEPRSESP